MARGNPDCTAASSVSGVMVHRVCHHKWEGRGWSQASRHGRDWIQAPLPHCLWPGWLWNDAEPCVPPALLLLPSEAVDSAATIRGLGLQDTDFLLFPLVPAQPVRFSPPTFGCVGMNACSSLASCCAG